MSSFVDSAQIHVKAGDGGAGSTSFRREAHVDKGGPDGGDGGHGGDVWLLASHNVTSLFSFKDHPHREAENGTHGSGKKKHGASGKSLVVEVPVGTVVKDLEGNTVVDLDQPGMKWLAGKGGQGGRGNARFLSNSRRAPNFSEQGEVGQEMWYNLELKLAADVAIIGFPNVGKSTLISMISAAKPKIADYPFTTLVPNLGVVHLGDDYEFSDFIVADIPGLIEGASQGKGLGHEFLRHIERAEALLVLIDLSDQALIDPATQLEVLIREITAYMPELAERPRLVVGSKIDATSTSKVDQFLSDGLLDLAVSSTTNQGIKELVNRLYLMVKDAKSSVPTPNDEIVIHRPTASGFDLIRDPDGVVRVIGRAAERSVALSNIGSPEALDYIQARLTKLGVNRALRRMGVREGDEVRIGAFSFDYQHDE